MNRRTLLIVATILLMAGTVLFLLPSDEKKIRRNLDSLAESCSSSPKEPIVESLKKAALAAKLCTTSCKIESASFHIARDFTRKEISDHILVLKKKLPSTRFSFHDTLIEFPDDAKAEVITTLRLEGRTGDTGFTDAYELKITTEKRDGDWLFSAFTMVEFMEK